MYWVLPKYWCWVLYYASLNRLISSGSADRHVRLYDPRVSGTCKYWVLPRLVVLPRFIVFYPNIDVMFDTIHP